MPFSKPLINSISQAILRDQNVKFKMTSYPFWCLMSPIMRFKKTIIYIYAKMFVNAWSIWVSVLAFLNPLCIYSIYIYILCIYSIYIYILYIYSIYIYTCNYLISPTQKSHNVLWYRSRSRTTTSSARTRRLRKGPQRRSSQATLFGTVGLTKKMDWEWFSTHFIVI